MDNLGKRLRWARKQRAITQTELAERSGLKQSDISKIERGDTQRTTGLVALAKALSCNAGWLDTGDGTWDAPPPFDNNVVRVPLGKRPYPVISVIQAGALKEITEPYAPGDGFDIEYGDDDWSRWTFALQIEGESMTPEFRPGDRVLIDPEIAAGPGDFVAAKNDGLGATFKKYRVRGINEKGDTVFELVPLNPDFPTLRSDLQPLCIIGVMVEHRKRYRRPRA